MNDRLDAVVAATPVDRDRVIDFLRGASILAVVAGHWLVATVVEAEDGLEGTNALADLPALRPLTWVFQVMPVFFLVGGFANWQALHPDRGPVDTGRFLAGRADRLLRPTVVFAAVWLALAAVLVAAADGSTLVEDVTRIAAQPLWFLAVYLLVVLAAPLHLRAHRRHPVATIAVLVTVVVGLDVLRLNEVRPGLAVGNYLAVFLVAQGLGFAHAEGRFDGVPPRRALGVAALALGVLTALTTIGPYPVSMIGLPGQRISNMSPPTTPILVLTVAQAALLLAARRPLQRWLTRPGPWRATIVVNLAVLSVFLWHLTAYIAVGAALLALGLPVEPVGTLAWWGQKVLLLALSLGVLVAIVAAVSPVERWPTRRRAPGRRGRRVLGAVAAVVGLAGLALAGFAEPFTVGGRALLGVRLSPAVAFALLAGGWLLARTPAEAPDLTR